MSKPDTTWLEAQIVQLREVLSRAETAHWDAEDNRIAAEATLTEAQKGVAYWTRIQNDAKQEVDHAEKNLAQAEALLEAICEVS